MQEGFKKNMRDIKLEMEIIRLTEITRSKVQRDDEDFNRYYVAKLAPGQLEEEEKLANREIDDIKKEYIDNPAILRELLTKRLSYIINRYEPGAYVTDESERTETAQQELLEKEKQSLWYK